MWRALLMASRVRYSVDVPSKHEQGADGEGHAYLGGDEFARAPVVHLRMGSADGVRWRPGGVSAAARARTSPVASPRMMRTADWLPALPPAPTSIVRKKRTVGCDEMSSCRAANGASARAEVGARGHA